MASHAQLNKNDFVFDCVCVCVRWCLYINLSHVCVCLCVFGDVSIHRCVCYSTTFRATLNHHKVLHKCNASVSLWVYPEISVGRICTRLVRVSVILGCELLCLLQRRKFFPWVANVTSVRCPACPTPIWCRPPLPLWFMARLISSLP